MSEPPQDDLGFGETVPHPRGGVDHREAAAADTHQPDAADRLPETLLLDEWEWLNGSAAPPSSLGDSTGVVYTDITRIAVGGQAIVLKAKDQRLGRWIILKVPRGTGTDEAAQARLLNEARATANVRHGNIEPVIDVGVLEPRKVPFIRMRFIGGPTPATADTGLSLWQVLFSRRSVGSWHLKSRDRFRLILLPLAGALREMHARGWVHRDLHPGNICLDQNYAPWLIDLGLATPVGTMPDRRFLGLPPYIAPEADPRNETQPAAAAMDVFAFGVVAYTVLAGKPPFDPTPGAVDGWRAVMDRVQNDDPVPLKDLGVDVPNEVNDAVMACLHKALERRPRNGDLVADRFELALEHWPEGFRREIPPVFPVEPASMEAGSQETVSKIRARVRLAAALGLVAVAVALAIAQPWKSRLEPTAEEDRTPEPGRAEVSMTKPDDRFLIPGEAPLADLPRDADTAGPPATTGSTPALAAPNAEPEMLAIPSEGGPAAFMLTVHPADAPGLRVSLGDHSGLEAEHGVVRLPGLADGEYLLSVTAVGFQTESTNLRIGAQTRTHEVRLVPLRAPSGVDTSTDTTPTAMETAKPEARPGGAKLVLPADERVPALANMSTDGAALPSGRDVPDAVARYRHAADLGEASAMNNLGLCYATGNGVPQSWPDAVAWYRRAADLGEASALRNLGWCFANGNGVTQSWRDAAARFRQAADLGEAGAMNNLGWCYATGNGVPQSWPDAVAWYRRAADLGETEAMRNLGLCYANGNGVSQSWPGAVAWYRRAADRGNANSMASLASCYFHGNGVGQSTAETLAWYRKAADLGHTGAMCVLGIFNENGTGLAQNLAQALAWYRQAAEAGNAIGMENYGRMLLRGTGGAPDPAAGREWLEKARAAGGENAAALLNDHESQQR